MAIPLVMVGGFLGAGKTTLLWQAARRLTAKGLRVGLITNDQAPDLVDTGLLLRHGLDVREVTGSCFCCDFPTLVEAASSLENRLHTDILIAEPVGSCTDLSATILQPLKDRHTQDFRLARLSVLADPTRIEAALDARATDLHPSAAYIVRKQLEEADVIVLNKADLLGAAEAAALRARVEVAFPGAEIRFISALSGQGVDEWLASTQSAEPAGGRILEIDYDIYAEGEAVRVGVCRPRGRRRRGWDRNPSELQDPAQPPAGSTKADVPLRGGRPAKVKLGAAAPVNPSRACYQR